MKILVNEKLSDHKFKTPEGYLICVDSILARTGKQTYQRNEVFHDGDTTEIEVDRTYDEVFSPKTLASFENKPITVEHPDEDVNSENYKDYAVGYVRDVKQGNINGENVILGTLVITDAQTIEEIENGEHTDLSCGYDCDIVDEENPQQRNIRGNHVALCQQGRAGIARIVDSVNDAKLPSKDRKFISNYLRMISTFTSRDVDIKDLLRPLSGHGYNWTIEKIDGWHSKPGQVSYKDYYVSIDGYDNQFKVTLYADPNSWKVTEVNAYFVDSIKDEELIEDDPPIYAHYLTKIKKGQDNSEILEKARKDYLMEKMSKNDYERLKKYAGQTDSIHDKKYVVISEIDEEEMDRFNSLAEAKKAIKEYKRFDKEEGNPFNESYRIEIEDSIHDKPIGGGDESDIDKTNYVEGKNGIWFAKSKSESSLLTKAYCSPDRGKTWYTCYLETKTFAPSGRTQVGKKFFRTSSGVNPRTAIGRNILTWYANNGVHKVDPNLEIDHVNGNYTDDRLSNLERITGAENKRRMQAMMSKDSVNITNMKNGAQIEINTKMGDYICECIKENDNWIVTQKYKSAYSHLMPRKRYLTDDELMKYLNDPSMSFRKVNDSVYNDEDYYNGNEIIEDTEKHSFEVVYIDRQSDKTERTYVDAKDKNEAIQKVKKMFKPYRIIECNVWDSLNDSSPIKIIKVIKVGKFHSLAEVEFSNGDHAYATVNRDVRSGQMYNGGAVINFTLSGKTGAAREFESMETISHLNKKYGEKEGYKKWMAGEKDSIDNFNELKNQIKNCKTRSQIREVLANIEAHHDEGLLTETEYNDLVNLVDGIKDSCQKDSYKKIHKAVKITKGLIDSKKLKGKSL